MRRRLCFLLALARPRRASPRDASPDDVAARLNAAYGRANGELGVFMHTTDMFNDRGDTFWYPTAQPVAWSDRISLSLVNARHPCPFGAFVTPGKSRFGPRPALGLVVAPAAVEACALCSWAHDGGTTRRVCLPDAPPGCVPGCLRTRTVYTLGGRNHTGKPPAPEWEVDPANRGRFRGLGPFRPQDLAKMLAAHDRGNNFTMKVANASGAWALWGRTSAATCHNEIVLAAECWVTSLPSAVVAFWVPWRFSGNRNQTLAHFRRFDDAYNDTVPAVLFDERRGATPFSAF